METLIGSYQESSSRSWVLSKEEKKVRDQDSLLMNTVKSFTIWMLKKSSD
jgi:glycerol kinase